MAGFEAALLMIVSRSQSDAEEVHVFIGDFTRFDGHEFLKQQVCVGRKIVRSFGQDACQVFI